MLTPGDTFMFAGRLLQFLRLRETIVEVREGCGREPKVPAYAGARMPMTTNLATASARCCTTRNAGAPSRRTCRNGSSCKNAEANCPDRTDCWWKHFPRGGRWYMVVYGFEGRKAHQTLGHAAHQTAGALRLRPAGLRRDRLCPRHLVGLAPARYRQALRGGHAGRRPGSLDGNQLHAPPHVPECRGDLRTDPPLSARVPKKTAASSRSTRT